MKKVSKKKTGPRTPGGTDKKAVPARAPQKAKKSKAKKAKSLRDEASLAIPATKPSPYICANAKCKLRSAGCYGAESCPGFRSRA